MLPHRNIITCGAVVPNHTALVRLGLGVEVVGIRRDCPRRLASPQLVDKAVNFAPERSGSRGSGLDPLVGVLLILP